MLIPVWFYKGLFYVALGAAALSLIYYAYRPQKDPERLPRAEIKGGSRLHRFLPWLPRIGLLGGLIGAWLLNHVEHDVIRVRDDGGTTVAERLKRLGEPDYPIAPGEAQHDVVVGYDTWVLNESSRTVRIEMVSYGRTFGWGPSKPTIIPPGYAVRSTDVEHLGPHDRPPHSVSVEGLEAKVGISTRSWLTWD